MSMNTELSDLFASIATLMEIKGENTFKVIAFAKVSRILKEASFDIRQKVEEGTVGQIEGIGKSSVAIIEEYARTGRSAAYEEIKSEVPEGLPALMQLEGMGPKTLNLLWKQRNITSLGELEKALAGGSLEGLKGIGPKKLDAMRKGIESLKKRTGPDGTVITRTLLGEAYPIAMALLERVRKIPGILHAEVAGSLRRRRETIGDVDIIAAIRAPEDGPAIAAAFVQIPGVEQVLAQGVTKSSVKVESGLQVDLRLVPKRHFGAALMYFTGSKEHNVRLRGLAQKKGMTLNEWGLYRLDEYDKSEKPSGRPPAVEPVASETEQKVYKALGLAYIPPELREDRGEVDLAAGDHVPALIARSDIRGDLHTHTTASDGDNSIVEMAEAAKALGYEYLAITDHSKAQAQANGLSPERLMKHIAEIRKAGEQLKGITLLTGSEVDILADGHLDYEDEVLAELDIVIASPHVALKQEPAKATDRLLRAIEHRYVNVIGHPTGRLLNGREGLSPDFAKLYAAAAKCGTALEINASYPRLDLDDVRARAAAGEGVTIAIDTDAHATGDFEQMEYGIGVARRAALDAKQVLNTFTLKSLQKFIAKKR